MCEHCASPLTFNGHVWLDIFGYITCAKHKVEGIDPNNFGTRRLANGMHEIRLERRSLERWLEAS